MRSSVTVTLSRDEIQDLQLALTKRKQNINDRVASAPSEHQLYLMEALGDIRKLENKLLEAWEQLNS